MKQLVNAMCLQNWFPGRGVSWLAVESTLLDKALISYNRFGMKADSSVWEQYLISFYWVCTTLSGNGLLGEVLPQNIMELVYCIGLMIINLTLFR